jgi:hypothetical protein
MSQIGDNRLELSLGVETHCAAAYGGEGLRELANLFKFAAV